VRSLDIAILATVVLSFGLLVTAHLCIVVGLSRRTPPWKSLAALVLAPLAPYWAIRERMYVRGGAWLVAALAYVVARAIGT
jgi:hypothetical protein